MNYPNAADEELMLATYSTPRDDVEAVIEPEVIRTMTAEAGKIFVEEHLLGYVVRLVTATRHHPSVLLGASPRASLALLRCSKASAYIAGRDHVIPDDIRQLAPHVLTHRIIVSPDAELDQITSVNVIDDCLDSTPYHPHG